MHNKEIKIYLLAKTVMSTDARRWLHDLKAEDFLTVGSDASNIVELAGRRCYLSFKPGLNLNVANIRAEQAEYIENILKSKHGSVLEHISWTFAIEGVTRVFTGEMNRHRAGVAISEGSMRYIRTDDIGWWLPFSISGTDEQSLKARRIFEEVFKFIEQKYHELEELYQVNEIKDFNLKKKLTSMFRRILPMGTSTGGIWTFNARALRHVLTMRCSPAAEEEIHYVCSVILDMMRRNEPLLFGDFNNAGVPTYEKV